MKNTKQRGFTLLEISIVLAIIGLMIGGILKGGSLLESAKVKNIINDLDGVSTALYAYQDRYRKIPGDDDQATTRWNAQSNVTSGNGNGVIEGCYNAATSCSAGISSGGVTGESVAFWNHLRAAEIITGTVASGTVALPKNSLGGYMGVQTGALGLETLVVCSANLTGRLALAIDTQTDDGNPSTGKVRAAQITSPNSLPVTAATSYSDDNNSMYVLCRAL